MQWGQMHRAFWELRKTEFQENGRRNHISKFELLIGKDMGYAREMGMQKQLVHGMFKGIFPVIGNQMYAAGVFQWSVLSIFVQRK